MSKLESYLQGLHSTLLGSQDLHVPQQPGFRRVWYCTNRAILDSRAVGPARFSNECGGRSYGLFLVKVNSQREFGKLDRLSFGITGYKRTQLIELGDESKFTPGESLLKIKQALEGKTNKQSLLFVHGYNVGFAAAIERAAQLAEDLGIFGEVFAFSWPSQQELDGYVADFGRADKSASDLVAWQQVIVAALGSNNCHTLHILAHSMGTRVAMKAITSLVDDSNRSLLLGEVILAAGDADSDQLTSWLDAAGQCISRVSNYASSTDRALKVSARLHRSERIGGSPLPNPQCDTIFCNGYGDDFFKHSYVFEARAILTDIRAVLNAIPCKDRHLIGQEGPRTWNLVFD